MNRRRSDPELDGADPTDERPAFVPEASLDEALPTTREPGAHESARAPESLAPAEGTPTDGTMMAEDTAPRLEAPLPSWGDDATVSLQANELASDLLAAMDDFGADDFVDSTLLEVNADQHPLASELLGPAGTPDLPGETPWVPTRPPKAPELPAFDVDLVETFEDEDLEATPGGGAPTVPLRPPPHPSVPPPPDPRPLDAVAFRRSTTPVPQAPSLSLPETAGARPLFEFKDHPRSASDVQHYAPTSATRPRGARGWFWALALLAVGLGVAVGWVTLTG